MTSPTLTAQLAKPAEIISEIDSALAEARRPEEGNELSLQDRARLNESRKWHKLTRALRIVAAVVLVASAATFMFQSWTGYNSVQRIFAFLGFSGLLSLSGILCGIGLKDDKGARVSLALAALMAPINFAQVGALLYSLRPGIERVPELFAFHASGPGAVLGLFAATLTLLTPVIYMAFSALAREHAGRFSAFYMALNASLLIPSRHAGLISLVSLGLIAALSYFELGFASRETRLKTAEGTIARFMLLAPLFVLLGRSLILYAGSSLLVSVFCAALFALGFGVIPSQLKDDLSASYLQGVSVIPMALGWLSFMQGMFFDKGQALLIELGSDSLIPMVTFPWALSLVLMSFFVRGSGKGYRSLAAVVAVIGTLLQLFTVGGLASSFLCVVTAILMIAASFIIEHKGVFAAGVFGLAVGLIYHLKYALEIYQHQPWIALAVLGLTVLICSSYLERNYSSVLERGVRFREKLARWS